MGEHVFAILLSAAQPCGAHLGKVITNESRLILFLLLRIVGFVLATVVGTASRGLVFVAPVATVCALGTEPSLVAFDVTFSAVSFPSFAKFSTGPAVVGFTMRWFTTGPTLF